MKTIRSWGPVVVWMVIIFVMSTRQELQVSGEQAVNFTVFKSLHLIEYATLFLLTLRAIKTTYSKASSRLWIVSAFMITVLYAISDEIHQRFVPTRDGKLRDVIIDALGAFIAWILWQLLLPKAPKTLRVWAKRLQLL